jgi:hypothetical protein
MEMVLQACFATGSPVALKGSGFRVQGFRVISLSLTLLIGGFRFWVNPEPLNH